MDKRSAICEYLKKYHTGKANAVYSRELEQLFGIDGRSLRRKISSLRKDGVPICSDESGYYYADSQMEIDQTVCRMQELAATISDAVTGLVYASVLPPWSVTVEVQIRLDSEVSDAQ